MNKILSDKKYSKLNLEPMISVIQETILNGGSCKLIVTGYSMTPMLINERDSVILSSASKNKINKGDIVFIKRDSGEYILHRVYKIIDDKIILNGDAQVWTEVINFNQIIGVANKIIYNGVEINCSNKIYRIIVNLWMLNKPFRMYIFRTYEYIKRLRKNLKVL